MRHCRQQQEAHVITEGEFVLIRTFNHQSGRAADNAQAIINRKNSQLVELVAKCQALQAELEAERGRRRRAEFLLNRH
jgi:hypothetical protein